MWSLGQTFGTSDRNARWRHTPPTAGIPSRAAGTEYQPLAGILLRPAAEYQPMAGILVGRKLYYCGSTVEQHRVVFSKRTVFEVKITPISVADFVPPT